jgi:hypothetical protein
MGLMKKLTSAIVTSSLVVSMVGTAFAAYTPGTSGQAACDRMMQLKVVLGQPGADACALNSEITRAELVTVIVRAFGQESNAKLLAGAAAYTDTANHWASGNIALAKNLIEQNGEVMGMPEGTFEPDAKLTPAQAVAFLMKFLGQKADATKSWPYNYLDKAVELGLITTADKDVVAPMLNDNATRGLAFYLFDNAFYSYKLADGKTFYTKYVDTTGPVLTLDTVEATTLADSVTVTGKADGASEVFVGTEKVAVGATGSFSAAVALPELKEYTITVTAKDAAGNTAEKSATVTRTVGTAASIEAADLTVAAGATADVAAVAKDAKGNATAEVITGTATAGAYADGKYTAPEKAGEATLTLTAGTITKTVKVTVVAGALATVTPEKASVAPGTQTKFVAKDQFGNLISGATFTQTSANAMLDFNTGTFAGFKAGTYTVTATKDGVSKEGTIGVYGDVAKFVVTAPETAVANSDTGVDGSTYNVVVTAVDENGNAITGYEGTVALSFAHDNTAVGYDLDASNATAKNGVATFAIYLDKALANQDITINAVDSNSTPLDDTDDITGDVAIAVVPQVATSITVSSTSDKYVVANDVNLESAVKVTVVDQNGKKMVDGLSYELTAAISGPANLYSGTANVTKFTSTAGPTLTYTVRSKKGETGAVTVTVTGEGLATATHSMTATVATALAGLKTSADVTEQTANFHVAGTLDNADNIATFTVNLVDKNGVPLKTLATDQAVKLAFDGKAAGNVAYRYWTDTNSNGVLDTGEWSAWTTASAKSGLSVGTTSMGVQKIQVVDKKAETVKFTLSSGTLTASDTAVAFKAGEATTINITRDADLLLSASNTKATLEVAVADTYGNPVAVDKEITIEADIKGDVRINGKLDKNTVTTSAGKATFDIEVAPIVTGTGWVLSATSDGLTTDTIAVDVVDAVASTMTVTVVSPTTHNPFTAEAGDEIEIRVYPKNNFGKIVENLETYISVESAGLALTSTATKPDTDLSTTVWTPHTTSGAVDYYTANLWAIKSGRVDISATMGASIADLKVTKSISVIPDAITETVVVADAGTTTVDGTEYNSVTATADTDKAFTLKVADKYGNARTLSTSLKVSDVSIEVWNDTTEAWDVASATDADLRISGHSVVGTAAAGSSMFTMTSTKGIVFFGAEGTYKITLTHDGSETTSEFVVVAE